MVSIYILLNVGLTVLPLFSLVLHMSRHRKHKITQHKGTIRKLKSIIALGHHSLKSGAVFSKKGRGKLKDLLQQKKLKQMKSKASAMDLFFKFDTDKSGTIDVHEFQQLVAAVSFRIWLR